MSPALNQIQRGDEIIRLEPKAIMLLTYLAGLPGEVVSREELLTEVWPGSVVTDDALTQVIIKLRKALGDNPKSPRYIQTISKRGYRLVATVTPQAAEPKSETIKPSTKLNLINRQTLTLAGSVVILIFVVVGFATITTWPWEETTTRNELESRNSRSMASPDAVTIAILPFETLTEGPQQTNFARAISADLTTDLSKLSGLWVINMPSLPEQTNTTSQTNPLLPRYLVSGSVQRNLDQLQVYIQLIDSSNGHQLWSERFDQPYRELFVIQENISKQIVALLEIQLTEAEQRRMAQRYTRNLEAYEFFLRAQADLLARQEPQNQTAKTFYWKAINQDPTFARAYAGLALSHVADYRNQWLDDQNAALQRAREMAETARQIDPEIAEVYWVLAYIATQQRHHAQALPLLEQALQLDQSFADAYALMGGINTYLGQPQKSVALLRNAMRLNPRAGYLYFLLLGRAYFFLDDLEQASVNLREALSRNPGNLEAHIYLAATLTSAEEIDIAEWEAEEIRALEPEFSINAWLETYPMTDDGQIKKLASVLAALSL